LLLLSSMLYGRRSSAEAAVGHGHDIRPCQDSTNSSFLRAHERAQAKMQRPAVRPRSVGPRAGPRGAVQAAQAASGDTETFLAFVDMITSKSPAEAQSMLALAAQAVQNRLSLQMAGLGSLGVTKGSSPYATIGSSMRRSASADELRRPFGSAKASRTVGIAGSVAPARRLPVRSRSAGGLLTSQAELLSPQPNEATRRLTMPAQSYAEMAYEMRARIFWDFEATRLQAAWRGRQHRRICRYLRARSARQRRLQWLADHGEVSLFIRWVDAAVRVQSAFRAKTGRTRPVSPPPPRRATTRPPPDARVRRLTWRDCVAEDAELCDVKWYDSDAEKGSWPEPKLYD